MKTMDQWLAEYGDSHRNPTNKAIHWICVPLILFSVLALLWIVPVPSAVAAIGPWLNWATVLMAAAFAYYVVLSPKHALGMALIALAMFLVIDALERSAPVPLWLIAVVVFVGAWVGQFIGHQVEGKKPSFFKDLQFLLIGPAWLLDDAYRRLGIH